MTDILSSDLFAVDKRLTLKPVRDFNAYLAAAFATGPCQCKRCLADQGTGRTGHRVAIVRKSR